MSQPQRAKTQITWLKRNGVLSQGQIPCRQGCPKKKPPPMPILSRLWATARFGRNWADLRVRRFFFLGLGYRLTARNLLAVKLYEIDVLKVKRWETTIAGHIADDAANEGEHHPRAFDQKEGMQLIFGDAFNLKNPDIFHFQQEQRIFGALIFGIDRQLEDHLILIVARTFLGIHIYANLNVRLDFAAAAALR